MFNLHKHFIYYTYIPSLVHFIVYMWLQAFSIHTYIHTYMRVHSQGMYIEHTYQYNTSGGKELYIFIFSNFKNSSCNPFKQDSQKNLLEIINVLYILVKKWI